MLRWPSTPGNGVCPGVQLISPVTLSWKRLVSPLQPASSALKGEFGRYLVRQDQFRQADEKIGERWDGALKNKGHSVERLALC